MKYWSMRAIMVYDCRTWMLGEKKHFYKNFVFFIKSCIFIKFRPQFFVQNFAFRNARTRYIERQKCIFISSFYFFRFFIFIFISTTKTRVWYISNVNIENVNLHIDISSVKRHPKVYFKMSWESMTSNLSFHKCLTAFYNFFYSDLKILELILQIILSTYFFQSKFYLRNIFSAVA